MEFITVENLTREYVIGTEKIKALNGVSFTIKKGDYVVILGPSGSGKSTLLNMLGGMDNPTSGNIYIDDMDISNFTEKKLTSYRRTDVGFVFQFYNLMPNLTARENVELSSRIGVNSMSVEETIDAVGLQGRMNHFPSNLSGGEQQRISIARAICKNPKLLLCDEPTGALDSETGRKILELLYKMNRENGQTVIVVTHNAVIAPTADRVIRLNDGQVIKTELNLNPLPIEEVIW